MEVDAEQMVADEAFALSQAITLKTMTLVEVVEGLQSSLNNENVTVREGALSTLKNVIQALPDHSLIPLEVSSMLTFFSSLLSEPPNLSRIAIGALSTIFSCHDVPLSDKCRFVESFFNDTSLVDLDRDEKLIIYRIFHSLLVEKDSLKELSQMQSAFIPGFLQLIEMETDPQCLMLCFSMFQIVCATFPMGVYVDDLFEFPAAYFPIDFNANPERHGGVSRELLQDSVEKCLLCHDNFAEPTIKLCLDKVSTDLKQAQIDGLKLLKSTIQRSKASVTCGLVEVIWPAVRRVYIKQRDTEEVVELVLRNVAVMSSRMAEVTDAHEQLGRFFQMIWKDLDNNDSLIELSGWRLIVAFAGGSPLSCDICFAKVLPRITQMITDEKQLSSALLEATCGMVKVISLSVPLPKNCQSNLEMLIAQVCSMLLQPFSSEHHSSLLRLIEYSLPIDGVYSSAQRETIKRYFERIATSPNPSVKLGSLKRLLSSCTVHFDESFSSDLHSLAVNSKCIWMLGALARDENCVEVTDELLTIGGMEAYEALRELLLSFPQRLVGRLAERMLQMAEVPDEGMESYADLLTVIVRNSSKDSISDILQNLCTSLPAKGTTLHLLQLRVILSNAPPTTIAPPLFHVVIPALIRLADEVEKSVICWQSLALLANKLPEGEELEQLVGGAIEAEGSLGLAYVSKALLMRGHPRFEDLILKAIDQLILNPEAAKSFSTIIKPEPSVFSKDGHCSIKILHAQRFFTFAIGNLLDRFITAPQQGRVHISTAICLSLQYIPQDIVASHVQKLRPIVLWSLSDDSLPPESSLGLLLCLHRSLPFLKQDINTVIPRLLRLLQHPGSPQPMQQTIEAIRCLVECRNQLETHSLLTYKTKVLASLPVGDRKRLVRQAAAHACMAWHSLGEAS